MLFINLLEGLSVIYLYFFTSEYKQALSHGYSLIELSLWELSLVFLLNIKSGQIYFKRGDFLLLEFKKHIFRHVYWFALFANYFLTLVEGIIMNDSGVNSAEIWQCARYFH